MDRKEQEQEQQPYAHSWLASLWCEALKETAEMLFCVQHAEGAD